MAIRGCPHVDEKAHSAVCDKYGTNGFHDGQKAVFFADIIETYEVAKSEWQLPKPPTQPDKGGE